MTDSKHEFCPVCGMKGEPEDYRLEYHKIFFHFCSAQCRETFVSHPGLYTGIRAHEHGEILKRRKLRLTKALDPDAAEAVTEYLHVLMGIKEAEAEGCWLTIHYDLLQLTLAQIETTLEHVDIKLDNGWWQRLRRSEIRNSEENELGNLAAPRGACCNHPPPGA